MGMEPSRKFVVAMDSFKGSLGSEEAGEAVLRALRRLFPEASAEALPLSDGGE
ncbi:MAG: glycerate kinase, partial [Fibrobacterales bacterium]|nr:glycerate kinase [Fibrobacterales bacterium]